MFFDLNTNVIITRGRELSPREADLEWAIGEPLEITTDAGIDRIMENPNPVPRNEASFENRMTHGKELFPSMRFYMMR